MVYLRPSSSYGISDSNPYVPTPLNAMNSPCSCSEINSKTPITCIHKVICVLFLLCRQRLNPIYHTDPWTGKSLLFGLDSTNPLIQRRSPLLDVNMLTADLRPSKYPIIITTLRVWRLIKKQMRTLHKGYSTYSDL